MAGRVEGKVALMVGGGQTPGETIGNGRATAIVLAREGAIVVVVDREIERAEDTVRLIESEGGEASAVQCDITQEAEVEAMISEVLRRYGRLDILHNNVGAGVALGDAPAIDMTVDAFQRSFDVNLKGMWLTCKHALPALRESGGSIVNIASTAVLNDYPNVGYKTMKTAVIALTQNLAAANAEFGVRVNAILPGLMNTPMAIEPRVAKGMPREELIASRDSQVPLGRKMGTGWDIGKAALFLHSDDASFITGHGLVVDGGRSISRRE
jgi:NAD(P)-dependent dehydrogenase (short-subunit alcohol dehydrogenase family)